MTETETETRLTPGPWFHDRDDPRLRPFKVYFRPRDHMYHPICTLDQEREDAYDNARLIAAAGNAAHELPDEYDPVAAVEMLPQLIDLCVDLRNKLHEVYHSDDPEGALDRVEYDRYMQQAYDVLQKAQRST